MRERPAQFNGEVMKSRGDGLTSAGGNNVGIAGRKLAAGAECEIWPLRRQVFGSEIASVKCMPRASYHQAEVHRKKLTRHSALPLNVAAQHVSLKKAIIAVSANGVADDGQIRRRRERRAKIEHKARLDAADEKPASKNDEGQPCSALAT